MVREKYGARVARTELAADPFLGGDMAVFVCRGGHLSEVRLCYEKMPDTGAPGERVACPGSLLREDSCGDEIQIASFEGRTTAATA